MDTKSGANLWSTGPIVIIFLVIIGVAGYFIYTMFFRKKEGFDIVFEPNPLADLISKIMRRHVQLTEADMLEINRLTAGVTISSTEQAAMALMSVAEYLRTVHTISDPDYMAQVKADFTRMSMGVINPMDVVTINDKRNVINDMLRDIHYGRKTTSQKEVREGVVSMKGARNALIDVFSVDGGRKITGTLRQAMPHLENATAMLPTARTAPMNLELADVINSTAARHYNTPSAVVRASTDERGLPTTLLEKVIASVDNKDPNSLQRSSKYDPIDILESAKGYSNQQLWNYGIDQYYTQKATSKLSNYQQLMRQFPRPAGSLTTTKYSKIMNDIHGVVPKVPEPKMVTAVVPQAMKPEAPGVIPTVVPAAAAPGTGVPTIITTV